MQVTIFRHGIAVDRADPGAPSDFERPLTLDGRHKTEAAARGLKALGLQPAELWSSPYRRCVQSARLVAQALGIAKRSVREHDALAPDGDPQALWDELSTLDLGAVMCVGHGGQIEPLAALGLGLSRPPRDGAGADDAIYRALHLKKAGALQLDVSFAPLNARLEWLLAPKILRQLGRS